MSASERPSLCDDLRWREVKAPLAALKVFQRCDNEIPARTGVFGGHGQPYLLGNWSVVARPLFGDQGRALDVCPGPILSSEVAIRGALTNLGRSVSQCFVPRHDRK